MATYDFTIGSIITRNANIYADRIGWVDENDKITHRKFDKNVNRLANGLLKAGVKKGDRIGVLSENNMAFCYLYGAAAKIGAIVLPINFRLSPNEIDYIISDGAPELLFVGSDHIPMVKEMTAKLNSVRKFYTMGEGKENFYSFHNLLENGESSLSCEVNAEDGFVIIHTAAVSGRPRGALLSHRSLVCANLQHMHAWQLTGDDCHLCMLPLFHVAALGTALNVMHAGGKNVVMPGFDPDRALRHIQDNGVTIFIEFPPMLKTLIDRNQELGCELKSLRVVVGLDELQTVKKFEELTGGTYWVVYGQTELSGLVTFAPYFDRMGAAGLPGAMAEVKIVDEYGNFLESGKEGEIVVRGPMVFNGYWNLAKDSEYTFRDGWHHTGDQGHFDQDGYLWYAGRMPEKELIKSGGENVYPAEVEKVILAHPDVEEACVIGIPDDRWGEAVRAVCVLKGGKRLGDSELIEFVAARIARYKKPKSVTFATHLPKTDKGQIDREKVKAEFRKA